MSELVLVCVNSGEDGTRYVIFEYESVASLCSDNPPFINQFNMVDIMRDSGPFSYNCYKDISVSKMKSGEENEK